MRRGKIQQPVTLYKYGEIDLPEDLDVWDQWREILTSTRKNYVFREVARAQIRTEHEELERLRKSVRSSPIKELYLTTYKSGRPRIDAVLHSEKQFEETLDWPFLAEKVAILRGALSDVILGQLRRLEMIESVYSVGQIPGFISHGNNLLVLLRSLSTIDRAMFSTSVGKTLGNF